MALERHALIVTARLAIFGCTRVTRPFGSAQTDCKLAKPFGASTDLPLLLRSRLGEVAKPSLAKRKNVQAAIAVAICALLAAADG